jgi:Uncharacterized protein conserved in bacteria
MKSRNDIEVLIEGRKYTICGFESDEYLQQIASYINRKFAEFKKKEYYHRMDLDVRNVLLAINIADDYFKTKKKAKDYRTESQEKDKTVLDMKHKIIDLQEQEKNNEKKMDELEQALEDAEKKIIELETRLKQRK